MLAEKQAINFMPFYSPTCRKAEFSCEEQELFQHCFEEGHDLSFPCPFQGCNTSGGRHQTDEAGQWDTFIAEVQVMKAENQVNQIIPLT